ncbi:10119_t:CDS:1, partial [Scutellospora calospora]
NCKEMNQNKCNDIRNILKNVQLTNLQEDNLQYQTGNNNNSLITNEKEIKPILLSIGEKAFINCQLLKA